jgi:Holliday junction resolvase RusA-like endonuclease
VISYYIVTGNINPEPWAIGPIGWSTWGGKKHPTVAPDPGLKTYQDAIKIFFAQNYPQCIPVEYDVKLTLFFWRKLDKNDLTSTGRVSTKHISDATNLGKGLEDALQKILYKNDRQVKRISSEIVEQGLDTKPGIVIKLEPYRGYSGEIPDNVMAEFLRRRDEAENMDLSDDLRMDWK